MFFEALINYPKTTKCHFNPFTNIFHRSSSNSLGSTASQKIQVMNWCSCHFKPKKSFLRKKPKKMMRKSENQVKPYEDMTLKMTLKSLTPPPSLQAQAVGSPTSSARHIYRWLVFDRAFWDPKLENSKYVWVILGQKYDLEVHKTHWNLNLIWRNNVASLFKH